MFNTSPTTSHHRSPAASRIDSPRQDIPHAGFTGPGSARTDNSPIAAPFPFVGVSSSLRRLLLQAEITASRLSLATLEGEAGAGKHLFAQTIHSQSGLAHLPFRRRDAREWLANEADVSALTGVIYLDRVDLLAPTGQGLLLNLIKSLQNDAARPPRLLLLASAQTPLRHLAGEDRFLPDLAFRLTAVRFTLPPLRDHREDLAPLAQALIDRICRHYEQPIAVLAPGTLHRLLQHSWPGNVRELASVLESAILDSTTGIIRPGDLALQIPREPAAASTTKPAYAQQPRQSADLSLDAAIRCHIQFVLDLHRGNKLRTARQLGISRSTLYRLLAGEPLSPPTSQPI